MLKWRLRSHGIGTVGALAAAALYMQAAPGPEDGQWRMPSKDFENTRYSGLDQIRIENAKNLRLAWTSSVGIKSGQEAAPIVVGDAMYIVTPYPNVLYAL